MSKMGNKREKYALKVRFYIMSLWLLFFLIFLLTVQFSAITVSWNPLFLKVDWLRFAKANVFSSFSLLLSLVGYCLMKRTQYEWKGVTNPPTEVLKIENENYEYLTFLTTYIIPLICIDFNNIRYVIVLIVLLLVTGLIFVKMDLYYANPTLILWGYHLYRAKLKSNDDREIILISTDKLECGQYVKWIELGKSVWVAKEVQDAD